MMKCWEELEGYENFVKQEWNGLRVDGWTGYVLKEKLKGIKAKLKEWNKEHCGNLEEKVNHAKEVLARLDLKCEVDELSLEKVEERRSCLQ